MTNILHRHDDWLRGVFYSGPVKRRTTMKRSPKLSIVIAIVLALCVAQGVAQAQTPRDLFQQALIQERAAGDLSKAIQLFQRAAKDAAGDRALAAEALIGAARSYEKLGQKKESRSLYAEVARSYSEQSASSAIARERLAETGAVQGTVSHSGDGAPVAGAKVSLSGGPIDRKALEPVLALYASRGVVMPVPDSPDEKFLQDLFDNGSAHGVSPANPNVMATVNQFRATNDTRFTATADVDGHFTIPNVLPGRYTVQADALGFFPAPTNAAQPMEFIVSAGHTTGADAAMLRGSTITGRVTDASGQPLVGVSVEAYSVVYRYGFPTMQPAVSKLTDDKGEYRLFYFAPGEYLVAVFPPNSKPNAVPGTTAQPVTSEYPPTRTFYPATTDISMAVPVMVRGENPVSGIDILLRTPKTFTISGVIHSHVPVSDNPPVVGANLGLRPRDTNVPDDYSTPVLSTRLIPNGNNEYAGNFQVKNVPSGAFNMNAWVQESNPDGGASTAFVSTLVDVNGQDITGLSLDIYPTVRLNGTVTVDGQAPGKITARVGLQVDGAPAKAGVYQGLMSRPVIADSQSGAFMIPAVLPGHFRVLMGQGLPPEFYVADIRQRSVSVLDAGFDVGKESPEPLQVIIQSGARAVEGTIRDAAGKPLAGVTAVLVPPQSRRQNRLLYRTAVSDNNGRYKIQGVAPGEYSIFAWEKLPDGAYFNDWFLSRYEDAGKKLNLGPGPLVGIDVKAIPYLGK